VTKSPNLALRKEWEQRIDTHKSNGQITQAPSKIIGGAYLTLTLNFY
jgi:hypothetical protein